MNLGLFESLPIAVIYVLAAHLMLVSLPDQFEEQDKRSTS